MLEKLLDVQLQQAKEIAAMRAMLEQRMGPAGSGVFAAPRWTGLLQKAATRAVAECSSGKSLQPVGVAVGAVQAYGEICSGSFSGAMIASQAVEPETQRRRAMAFQEFAGWYVSRMQPLGMNCNAANATPEELVVYHESHWIGRHGETLLQDRLLPSPGYLEGNFSALSGIFENLGRTGPYSEELRIGNPVQSRIVRNYKEGYARLLRAWGYAVTSATHLSEAKLRELVERVTADQVLVKQSLNWSNKGEVLQYALVERDLLGICGLWECFCRGKEMGVLVRQRVQDRQGHSLYPRLLLDLEIQAGMQYQIAPSGTKTVQRARAGVVWLEARGEEDASLCFLRRLQSYGRLCLSGGLKQSNFILQPEARHHRDFNDAAMNSGALNKRFQALLKKYGLFGGETLHGIRRGTMQDSMAAGASLAEVGAKALQATPAVTRMYVDTSRETYGPILRRGARRNLK